MINYYTTWLRSVEPKLPPMTEVMKDKIVAEAAQRGLRCYRDSLAWFWSRSTSELSTTWRLVLWMPYEYVDFTRDMANKYGFVQTVVATHPEPLVRIDPPGYVYGLSNDGAVRVESVWMFPDEARAAIQRYAAEALRSLEGK